MREIKGFFIWLGEGDIVMQQKTKMLNILIVVGFISLAAFNIHFEISFTENLIVIMGLLILLFLGNYSGNTHKKRESKSLKVKQHKRTSMPLFLFFIFLACELIIMIIMICFNNSLPLKSQKLLACLLCVSIFCMVAAGYKFEVNRFQTSKTFSEVRKFGIAINPKHPIGRIIYASAFVLILIIFCLLLIFGPTN
ncbi:hypothetical protein ACFSN5_09500 [Streptococcus tangpeifui]|uniref:hypothetical protein n=1 Tax=Streptococcus tangpeifui TaxID=2709400 RepID=UPI0032176F2D